MDRNKVVLAAIAGSMAAIIWCGINTSSGSKEAKADLSVYGYSAPDYKTEYQYTPTYDYDDDTSDYDYDALDDGLASGTYWCMGKGDTCQNKTYSAYDFYCSACDPDGDNIEG